MILTPELSATDWQDGICFTTAPARQAGYELLYSPWQRQTAVLSVLRLSRGSLRLLFLRRVTAQSQPPAPGWAGPQ